MSNKQVEEKREYDKYCGDKDLWEKYSMGQVFYKGKAIGEPQEILSISRYNGGIGVNFRNGSFPLCDKVRNKDEIIIRNGYKCDLIKLYE